MESIITGVRLTLCSCLLGLLIMPLTACQSAASEDENAVHIHLIADKKTNPNEKGQPSPVSVRIYELKSTDAFLMSDYFTIVEGSDAELLAQSKKTYEAMIKPGEKREMTFHPVADTVALGIVVAYRDITHAQAIKTWPLNIKKARAWYAKWLADSPPQLAVNIEPLAISIKEVD